MAALHRLGDTSISGLLTCGPQAYRTVRFIQSPFPVRDEPSVILIYFTIPYWLVLDIEPWKVQCVGKNKCFFD
jgi:hypothetical protein